MSSPAPIDSSEVAVAQASIGYRTTVAAQGVRLVCKVAGVVVLARLVSPAEHGLFAMAASLTFFLTLFRDLGGGNAAIQARELSETQKTTLLWLHIALGAVLAVSTLALAPFVARFFGEPLVGPLLAVMSASFVLNGGNAWPRALLARELRFTELNRIETWAALLGTSAMIGAGVAGAGAYSFAVYLLVSEALMLVAAWRMCRWRPTARLDWSSLTALSATGFHLTNYQFLNYVLMQADTILMGRWFGAGALGLYNRAGQLLAQPANHLAAPFGQVLLATLSRLGASTTSFARQLTETATTIAHLTLPVAVVCAVLPDEMVQLVLGNAWPDAAPLLQWLSIGAMATFLTSTVYSLCVAAGNSARLSHLALAALPVLAIGLALGRSAGPTGLAAAVALTNVVLLLPRLWWSARGTAVSCGAYVGAFIGPLGVNLALALGLFAGNALASASSDTLRVISSGLLGGAAYAGAICFWPRARAEWQRLWAHLPFTKRKASTP